MTSCLATCLVCSKQSVSHTKMEEIFCAHTIQKKLSILWHKSEWIWLMSGRCYRCAHTKSMGEERQWGSCLYGLRENSVNENHALCRVITGHEHVYVYVCVWLGEGRERDRERAWGLLYNAVEPVYVVLGRSLCDISGLTDVLIGKKSLFKFGKSGIL